MIRAVIFDMYETLITHYHGNGPLYFSLQMAEEAGVSLERFQAIWRGKEKERTIGNISLEETLEFILKENQVYSEDKVKQMAKKRTETAGVCFENLHPEIVPMLEALHGKGIRIGLISNCFSEEAKVIRQSRLAPYFDALCLSYELGVRKPEAEIYDACVSKLGVNPKECLYVGDGGSNELEAARNFGMTAVQATWYLSSRKDWTERRKDDFYQVKRPLDIVQILLQDK